MNRTSVGVTVSYYCYSGYYFNGTHPDITVMSLTENV